MRRRRPVMLPLCSPDGQRAPLNPPRDRIDIELVDKFYKLKSDTPTLGSRATFPLQVESKGKTRVVPPTYDYLCWHFGFYERLERRIADCIMRKIPLENDEITALRRYWRTRFVNNYVLRVRREFARDFWFYCVPREVYAKDLVTGELKRGKKDQIDEEATAAELVLTALPVNAGHAQETFKLPREFLEEMALQHLWLMRRLVSHHILPTSTQFLQQLQSWTPFAPPELYKAVTDKVKGFLPA